MAAAEEEEAAVRRLHALLKIETGRCGIPRCGGREGAFGFRGVVGGEEGLAVVRLGGFVVSAAGLAAASGPVRVRGVGIDETRGAFAIHHLGSFMSSRLGVPVCTSWKILVL